MSAPTKRAMRAAYRAGANADDLGRVDDRYRHSTALHNAACDGATLGLSALEAWTQAWENEGRPDVLTDAAFTALTEEWA